MAKPKIQDDPAVAELLAKREAKLRSAMIADHVRVIKGVFAVHLNGGGDRPLLVNLKEAQRAIVAALKAPA